MVLVMKTLLARLSPQSINKQPSFWHVPGRIAYIVNHSYPYSSNGYAVRTHGVARALEEHGHSVVAINRPGLPWDFPSFENDQFPLHHEIDGVRYLHLPEPSHKGILKTKYLAASAETLKTTLRVFKPNVVMAASNWENALPAAVAARELGLPFFYEVRGFWEITRASREPEWQSSAEFKQYVEMETIVAQAADRVFTLNRFMRDELVHRDIDAAKIALVPNGYGALPDPTLLPRLTKADIDCNTRHVVGYVGSFNDYEGLDDLVRACAQLRKLGVDLSLLLVGSSSPIGIQDKAEECRVSVRLKQLARELNFAEYLHLPGRVSPEALADYYALIDLVVIPRKPLPVCELVSPIKPLEASALGKAILMSDVEPLREIAEKSKAAELFKAGDIDDCAKNINKILFDEDKLLKLRRKARQWVQSGRSWLSTTQTLHNALLSVMTNKQHLYEKYISAGNRKIFIPDLGQRHYEPKQLAKDERISIGAKVKAGDTLLVKILATDAESPSPKGIVAEVRYFDKAGQILSGPFSDLGASPRYPAYFYVTTTAPEVASVTYRTLVVPAGATKIEIHFVCHLCQTAVVVTSEPLVHVMDLEIIHHLLETSTESKDWMPAAVKFAQAQGSCTLLKRILRAWVMAEGGAPEIVRRWAAVNAELEELEPAWYPKLGVKSSIPSTTGQLTICHLHKTAYPFENTGGAIRCLNILKSQQELGLDPYLITPPGYPKSGAVDGALFNERVEGIEHFRIGPDTAGIKTLSLPARTRFAAVQSAYIVKRRGASLIHAASGVRGYELALQAFALRDMFDIPVIYEVRSFHEHTWAPAKEGILDLERTQLRILKENRCMEMADHIVTISETMRDILIQRGVPAEKIDVVPNAIDESRYQDSVIAPISHEALVGAELVVGYVSNMSLREGHRYLLKAVAQLRSTGFDVRCLLVGSGPERQSLESFAQQLGISKFTAFVGEVDHSMINSYYLAIDVFVVPRVPDYAADWVTPLKPYEAMSLGRPLVVTDLPALREVTGNGERGRIAQPADSESLCKEILALANDQAARTAMAKAGKKWVFENRTWAANAKRYRDIYGHVLREYRQRRCRNTLNSNSSDEFLIAANQN